MKNFILQTKKAMIKSIFLIALLFILFSCESDKNNYTIVKGRVEREINGQSIPNQKLSIKMVRTNGSGGPNFYTDIIDEAETITDSNGNFSVSMKNEGISFVKIVKLQDDKSANFEQDFMLNKDIVVKLNNFIKFKIYVNNTNPFDSNDEILINFFSGSNQSFRTQIENFGSQNLKYPAEVLPGGGIVGPFEEAAWKGTNVNSIIYYNVPDNDTIHKIYCSKTKNLVTTTNFTQELTYNENLINEYHLDY